MKKLLVLSGKGGTGKTTVSAGLIRLSQARAVADCDVDAPNLHLVVSPIKEPQVTAFMGGDKACIDYGTCIGCGRCQEVCRFGAIKLVDGKAVVNEFMCEGCGVCGAVCKQKAITLVPDEAGRKELYVDEHVFSTATLKMGRGNSGKIVTDVKLAMIKSAPECDLAIMDGSPGIGCPVMASMSGMDYVLIVVEPSNSGISDLKRLLETVEGFQIKALICVNKADTSPQHTLEIEAYCEQKKLPFVGKLPYDKEAVRAVNSGYTIVDVDCKAGEALREIYKNIIMEMKG